MPFLLVPYPVGQTKSIVFGFKRRQMRSASLGVDLVASIYGDWPSWNYRICAGLRRDLAAGTVAAFRALTIAIRGNLLQPPSHRLVIFSRDD